MSQPGTEFSVARPEQGLGAELRRLAEEISDALDVPCVVGVPTDPPKTYVQLDTVRVKAPLRTDRSVARIDAEVMISVQAADAADAADLLARCMLDVLGRGHWEIVPDQPDLALWNALGRPAAAAFMLKIPVTAQVERRPAPPVRFPLDLRTRGLRAVRGTVTAADGTPIPGARIRTLPNGLPAVTDTNGRWALSIPDMLVHLEVLAKGTRTVHDVPPDSDLDLPANELRPPLDITIPQLGATPPPDQPAT